MGSDVVVIVPDHRFSRPLASPDLRIISLGAGLQSSWLCDAAARGDIGPMPDMAIFADTGHEPRHVYAHLDELSARLPFPVIRTAAPGPTLGDLTHQVVRGERTLKGSAIPPLYVTSGDSTMWPKQCSGVFKRDQVVAVIRQMMGLAAGQRGPRDPAVEVWVGISRDEIDRMSASRVPWIHNRHPCIEMGLRRPDIVRWYEERQMRVPGKSSCVWCPFRSDAQWLEMKRDQPGDFEDACRFDDQLRPSGPDIRGELYVHRSRRPLRDADLAENQMGLDLDGSTYECEGHCNT